MLEFKPDEFDLRGWCCTCSAGTTSAWQKSNENEILGLTPMPVDFSEQNSMAIPKVYQKSNNKKSHLVWNSKDLQRTCLLEEEK